jgi:hypothetical protein
MSWVAARKLRGRKIHISRKTFGGVSAFECESKVPFPHAHRLTVSFVLSAHNLLDIVGDDQQKKTDQILAWHHPRLSPAKTSEVDGVNDWGPEQFHANFGGKLIWKIGNNSSNLPEWPIGKGEDGLLGIGDLLRLENERNCRDQAQWNTLQMEMPG